MAFGAARTLAPRGIRLSPSQSPLLRTALDRLSCVRPGDRFQRQSNGVHLCLRIPGIRCRLVPQRRCRRHVAAGRRAACSGSATAPRHSHRQGILYITYSNDPGPNGVSYGAVWKLDTNTGTWTDISPVKTGQPQASGYAGLAVDFEHPDTLMVSTMDRWNPGDTVFRSINGGKTWEDIRPNAVLDWSLTPYLTFGITRQVRLVDRNCRHRSIPSRQSHVRHRGDHLGQ